MSDHEYVSRQPMYLITNVTFPKELQKGEEYEKKSNKNTNYELTTRTEVVCFEDY